MFFRSLKERVIHRQHRKFTYSFKKASSPLRSGHFQRLPETRNVGLDSFTKTAGQEWKIDINTENKRDILTVLAACLPELWVFCCCRKWSGWTRSLSDLSNLSVTHSSTLLFICFYRPRLSKGSVNLMEMTVYFFINQNNSSFDRESNSRSLE